MCLLIDLREIEPLSVGKSAERYSKQQQLPHSNLITSSSQKREQRSKNVKLSVHPQPSAVFRSI